MTVKSIQSAHNPELFNTRSVVRPLSKKETMQRASAVCASRPSPKSLPCTGQIFIGMFFDGTGNNENEDYLKVKREPAKQKHSNVVRLYHAYPDKITKGTTKHYAYYIPGVGTPFPEISDSGGKLGTGASWNGEPRLIWGITRVFNAVSNYVSEEDIIPEKLAGDISNAQGGMLSVAIQREHVFKSYWSAQLKAKVLARRKDKPRPEQINLSVYGFSRGAAEARAFVNWLYAICDEEDGAYLFCGIPLRVEFLGIFDTVASVGIAGGFTAGLLGSEGHQSWAKDNMQIHKGVECCLHIIAAHEVRATFPVDSVRINGTYPPNVKEYVYPGAHSDIGGGYHPKAQGKTDALARIPGFEMYCAALAAGVPFISLKDLKKDIAGALVPSQLALDNFKAYSGAAAITAGPTEDMMHQHMAHYFRYRYQARRDPINNPQGVSYIERNFYKIANKTTPDGKDPKEFLRDTQQHFIAVLAAVSGTLEHVMDKESSYDKYVRQPFQSEGSYVPQLAIFNFQNSVVSRAIVLRDSLDSGQRDVQAYRVHKKLPVWRKWLTEHTSPDLVDADAPERDVLAVVGTLSDTPQPKEIVSFFDDFIHDSMAGLAGDGVNEFLINGVGIAKFRRIYFGNSGDAMLHEKATEMNEQRTKIANEKRRQKEKIEAEQKAQRRQWDLESAEFARTQS